MEAPEAEHLPLPPQHLGCMSRSGALHSQLLLHLYNEIMFGFGLAGLGALKIDVYLLDPVGPVCPSMLKALIKSICRAAAPD